MVLLIEQTICTNRANLIFRTECKWSTATPAGVQELQVSLETQKIDVCLMKRSRIWNSVNARHSPNTQGDGKQHKTNQ